MKNTNIEIKMQVKDLIKILKKFPSDAQVKIGVDDGYIYYQSSNIEYTYDARENILEIYGNQEK